MTKKLVTVSVVAAISFLQTSKQTVDVNARETLVELEQNEEIGTALIMPQSVSQRDLLQPGPFYQVKQEVEQESEEIVRDGKIKSYQERFGFSMEVNRKSELPEDVLKYLLEHTEEDKNDFLKNDADLIIKVAEENNIDAIFLAAIPCIESGWGAHQSGINNFGGIKGNGRYGYRDFSSGEEYWQEEAKLLSQYLREDGKFYEGNTISDVNINYCVFDQKGSSNYGEVNTNWSKQVYTAMTYITRDLGSF